MSATCSVPASVSSTTNRPVTLSRTSGAMALTIRIAGAGGMFLSHIVLARSLGVVGFGEYSLAIAWLQVLTVAGKLGLDNTSLRYVAEYVTRNETGKLRGFLHASTRASLLASTTVASLVIALVFLFRTAIGESLSGCLIVAALMIPLVSLRQIQEASLRGVGRLFESQISTVVWPVLLSLLATVAWQTSSSGISSLTAAILHLIAVVTVSIMVYQFQRQHAASGDPVSVSDSCRQQWKNTAMAFLFAEGLIALKSRACVAMAGMLLDRESVGLYGAMEKFADVSVLASQSLGLIIAPQFASLYAAGRYPEMRRLMRQGQFLGLAFTLPVALGVAIFGEYLFVLLGPGYRAGWSVLMTLLASACIAAFSGPAAYVLQMTGRERTMLAITAASAATNILLSLMLMPAYGIMGLGIAQMATSLVWTVGVRSSLAWHPVWQNPSTVPHAIQNEVSR